MSSLVDIFECFLKGGRIERDLVTVRGMADYIMDRAPEEREAAESTIGRTIDTTLGDVQKALDGCINEVRMGRVNAQVKEARSKLSQKDWAGVRSITLEIQETVFAPSSRVAISPAV
jgi:hypothetical protein